jgi:hypothetical protein
MLSLNKPLRKDTMKKYTEEETEEVPYEEMHLIDLLDEDEEE